MKRGIRCPDCHARIEAPETSVDHPVVCPRCGKHFVPADDESIRPSSSDAVAQPVRNRPTPPSWYCLLMGQELGPMTFDDLLGLAKNGQLLAHDVVRETSTGEWKCASEVPVLAEVTATPRQSKNDGEVTAPLVPVSPVSRWTPAIIAASVTAVVSVTACWFLLPQPQANVAVLPAGNVSPVASQQPPPGSSAPQSTPTDKQTQPAVSQTQAETKFASDANAADSAAVQLDAPDEQPQPAAPEIQPEKKSTPGADNAGSVNADENSELRGSPSGPAQEDTNEEINRVNMAPAAPSHDEPGHAEINAGPDPGPGDGKSSALSKIGLGKLDDPLADSVPNRVASGPNAPQKITRQEIASPSSTNSPAEDRLARLRLIYSRRAEILAERNRIVARINEATIERDAA
ncbi:MAG TPA: GYF domain-containing protein, partial [Pirellulales bacterium]|nr:GYF domain-containing protein [Pirellulales bacterium]